MGTVMPETIADRYRRWGVEELLRKYPDLRIVPSRDETLKVGGDLHFRVRGPTRDVVEDSYCIELRIPPGFPTVIPAVLETGGRIPRTYHKLTDGSLCLAAPTELRLKLGPSSTLSDLIERFVVPYLFGYSYYERHGVIPYGELEHGREGLRQYFASLYGVTDRNAAQELVRLTSLKKRPANKELCPCGSDRRLGKCHHLIVNDLRTKLGRACFERQYKELTAKKLESSARPGERLPRRPSKRRRRCAA
jgi:hypothetical protein